MKRILFLLAIVGILTGCATSSSLKEKLTNEQLDTIFDVPKDVLDTAYRLIIVPKMVEFVKQCIREKNFRIFL